jgi:hypothetical protein
MTDSKQPIERITLDPRRVARTMYACTDLHLSQAERMEQVFRRDPELRAVFARNPHLKVPGGVEPGAVFVALARTTPNPFHHELRRAETESASDRVMSLARVEMERDRKLEMGRAIHMVFRRDPALYKRYRAEGYDGKRVDGSRSAGRTINTSRY